jgi:hypothetical protein
VSLRIPIHDFPVNETGALDLRSWHRWLQHREAVEGTQTKVWATLKNISITDEQTDSLPWQPGCDITYGTPRLYR